MTITINQHLYKTMEEKPINPPSFYERDSKTEICVLCEYEFIKANMNLINDEWYCNKCVKDYYEQPNENDKP